MSNYPEDIVVQDTEELLENGNTVDDVEEVTQTERQNMQPDFSSNMSYEATRALHEFIISVAVQGGLQANDAWAVQGHVQTSSGHGAEIHQKLIIVDDDGNDVHPPDERGGYKRIGIDNLGDFIHPMISAHLREAIHIIAKRIKRTNVTMEEMLDPTRRALFERLTANRMRMSNVLSGHQYLLDKTHDRLNLQAKHIIDAIMLTFNIHNSGRRSRKRRRLNA